MISFCCTVQRLSKVNPLTPTHPNDIHPNERQTPLGAFLDPLADKLFIGAVALGLTMTDVLPPLLTFVIVGRDVLLVSGSFYLRAKEKEESASFFDIDTTTFDVKPSLLSKVKAAICQYFTLQFIFKILD